LHHNCTYHCKALFHRKKGKKIETKVLKWKPHYALKYVNAVDGSGGVGKKQKEKHNKKTKKKSRERKINMQIYSFNQNLNML
jgi:hypothetical protein